MFIDLLGMLSGSGLSAVHGSIRATQQDGKECEEVQLYGTDMKKEASSWYDVGEKSVLEKYDQCMSSLICALIARYFFAWIPYAVYGSAVCRRCYVRYVLDQFCLEH